MKLWIHVIILSAFLSVLFPQEYRANTLIEHGFENVYQMLDEACEKIADQLKEENKA